tara:strand:+ start:1362 stop:2054 length:693 start_codon:yes stop_codon:yes gene_type:complete
MTGLIPKTNPNFWQDGPTVDVMNQWCGDYNSAVKTYIREEIKDKKGINFLDCGAGTFSQYFGFKHNNLDVNYKATEITKKYIEYGLSKNINVTECPLNKMPFKNDEFDITSCIDVMNHQSEFDEHVKEMLRVTKDILYISFFKHFEETIISCKDNDEILNEGDVFPLTKRDGISLPATKTSTGIIVKRYNGLVYNHFNFEKLVNFLNTLHINFTFYELEDEVYLLKIIKK